MLVLRKNPYHFPPCSRSRLCREMLESHDLSRINRQPLRLNSNNEEMRSEL